MSSRTVCAPLSGQRVGPFVALEVLGRGGYGTVYRAVDPAAGHYVALKVLHQNATERSRARFVHEGIAAASLRHPGLVGIHTAGEDRGRLYLAFQLVENHRTLKEVMPELPRCRRVELVLEIARAVGYAHQHGVIHRDLKPKNVLIDAEGRVRVTDFGLSLSPNRTEITLHGTCVGTPAYMAPEQIAGHRSDLGPATDVWALGVLLYRALVESRPFMGSSMVEVAKQVLLVEPRPPREHDPRILPALEAVCLRALAKRPRDRFSDAAAMADALAAALEPRETVRRPAATRPAPPRPLRARRFRLRVRRAPSAQERRRQAVGLAVAAAGTFVALLLLALSSLSAPSRQGASRARDQGHPRAGVAAASSRPL